MKNTKKLKRKHFRHLTKEEIKNPLYVIAEFCRCNIDLITWKIQITRLIKASNTTRNNVDPGEADDYLFYSRKLLKHIELLYVLYITTSDWSLNEQSGYYRVEKMRGQIRRHWHFVRDETLDDMFHFKQLTTKEVENFGIFLKRLFKFKTLRQWQHVIDDLLTSILGETNFSEFTAYWGTKQKKVFKYLKKVTEAIFFIYVTKAKEHIFKYHVKDFHLEKYLDPEETETIKDVVGDESHHSEASSDETESKETVENLPSDEASDEVI